VQCGAQFAQQFPIDRHPRRYPGGGVRGNHGVVGQPSPVGLTRACHRLQRGPVRLVAVRDLNASGTFSR
jgi:hypothetical protein